MATPPHVSAVPPSAVTLVTQTRVSPSHDEEFARWREQVNHALVHFPGYLDHTVLPPHPPAQVDWVVVQRRSCLPRCGRNGYSPRLVSFFNMPVSTATGRCCSPA